MPLIVASEMMNALSEEKQSRDSRNIYPPQPQQESPEGSNQEIVETNLWFIRGVRFRGLKQSRDSRNPHCSYRCIPDFVDGSNQEIVETRSATATTSLADDGRSNQEIVETDAVLKASRTTESITRSNQEIVETPRGGRGTREPPPL